MNELGKQLKREFPLASQTAEHNVVERDNVVHIYYKVLMTVIEWWKVCLK